MNVTQKHFADYLGTEETNLLASIINFRGEFDLFYNIDEVYRAPLNRLIVGEDEAVIPQLYLFVHFHMYFAVSCILRSHLSDALSSTRKAIDAGLTAYELILDPESTKAYIESDKRFRFIKAHIKQAISTDTASYPLVGELLTLYEVCSEFGSHADISSFFHRLEILDEGDGKKERILVHYFQFPRNSHEYRFHFLVILQTFFLIFRIFKLFFDDKLKIIDATWEGRIADLGPTLDRQRRAAYEKIGEKDVEERNHK